MTEVLARQGGRIAHEVAGTGPLVVLAHGMGDSRAAYRFVTPGLLEAGYRVAALDLRGCGRSSAEWSAYTRTDIAGDLLGLVRHLGGAGPDLVTGVVELAPFTRKQALRLRDLRAARDRTAMLRLLMAAVLADDVGLADVTMGLLAERLGGRPRGQGCAGGRGADVPRLRPRPSLPRCRHRPRRPRRPAGRSARRCRCGSWTSPTAVCVHQPPVGAHDERRASA